MSCQDCAKVEVLLRYLFDPAALRGACREDCLKLYDKQVQYVGKQAPKHAKG